MEKDVKKHRQSVPSDEEKQHNAQRDPIHSARSPSGKAEGFEPSIRRFDPCPGSHIENADLVFVFFGWGDKL